MESLTIAEKLSGYTTGLRYEDLPDEATHAAKRMLLDTLGCALAGYTSESSKIVRSVVKELDGPKESTIIGNGIKTSCSNAILANGAMARYHDFQSVYFSPKGGPCSPSMDIPALLAVGEKELVTGKELITSIFLDVELTGRFVDSFEVFMHGAPPSPAPWHTSTYSQYVVPLTAGKLLGLNQNQMANAMGISGSHNVTLYILDAPGEPFDQTRNIAWAFGGQSGYLGALLARKGFTGPLRIIEGNHGFLQSVVTGECDVKHLVEGGETPKILHCLYKASCACAAAASTIYCAAILAKEHAIKAEDIDKIDIYARKGVVGHVGDPSKRFPESQESAGHSLHYLVSSVIIDGVIGPDQFTSEKLADARVHALCERITVNIDHELEKVRDKRPMASRVEIWTRQGEKYSHTVDFAKGHHANPFSDQDAWDKFRLCTSKVMSEDQITEIIDAVSNLERMTNVGELMELLII